MRHPDGVGVLEQDEAVLIREGVQRLDHEPIRDAEVCGCVCRLGRRARLAQRLDDVGPHSALDIVHGPLPPRTNRLMGLTAGASAAALEQ